MEKVSRTEYLKAARNGLRTKRTKHGYWIIKRGGYWD